MNTYLSLLKPKLPKSQYSQFSKYLPKLPNLKVLKTYLEDFLGKATRLNIFKNSAKKIKDNYRSNNRSSL